MAKILPLLLILIGLASGAAAGFVLKPKSDAHMACGDGAEYQDADPGEVSEVKADCAEMPAKDHATDYDAKTEFVKLDRQFVVPLVNGERVESLVLASLSVEVEAGTTDAVVEVEPKLRDTFLSVLFVHAHSGGFSGEFTSPRALDDLRERLNEVAKDVIGPAAHTVLITEIVRQDM